ncbi:hypothetical protein [Bacteroides thetaiotaomicron]|uniref:hypothetical protein n=1 Tax=Bacteroides thetaiotaomicron TaxID=818 RepID=UPI001C38FBAC|nr:hypothetical protein [Bacteroides thetaiotaomicron]MBV4331092.1 hypothetical protein [Bacteroides thetaiotaomicron]
MNWKKEGGKKGKKGEEEGRGEKRGGRGKEEKRRERKEEREEKEGGGGKEEKKKGKKGGRDGWRIKIVLWKLFDKFDRNKISASKSGMFHCFKIRSNPLFG